MALLLLLLIFVPGIAWFWAGSRATARRWQITGIAFGVIVAPFGLALYAAFFLAPIVSPLNFILGLIGLGLSTVHGLPGYEVARLLGVVEERTVAAGAAHLCIQGINALVWAPAYGALGWYIDRRAREDGSKKVPTG